MAKPSQQFETWLKQFIESHPDGTSLPHIGKITSSWSISEKTARRILNKFRDNNQISCIPGKGSFVGKVSPDPEPEPQILQTTQTDIYQAIIESIRSGEQRIGDPLPSVKFMSYQYGVSRKAVIEAYGRLRNDKIIIKIGRTFWLGSNLRQVGNRKSSVIYYLKHGDADFSVLSKGWGNPFDKWIVLIYQKMGRELATAGIRLQFESMDVLPGLLRKWQKGSAMPYGIFLIQTLGRQLKKCSRLFDAINNARSPLYKLPALIFWQSGSLEELPRSAERIAFGNMINMRARTIAQAILMRKYDCIKYYFDESQFTFERLFYFAHIRSEIKHIMPQCEFKIVIKPSPSGSSKQQFLNRMYNDFGQAKVDSRLSKYKRISHEQIHDEYVICEPFSRQLRSPSARILNIFLSDSEALDALQWAGKRGYSVPKDFGVLSLEDNPAYYHENISSCVPDWERIGYLMAHSLLGDIPIEKTSKGFIRASALFLDRGSM